MVEVKERISISKFVEGYDKLANEQLKDKLKYNHLTLDTLSYEDGVMLAPVFLVKGLEFDAVIVVDADNENYCTQIDRQALYVAATRALSCLTVVED